MINANSINLSTIIQDLLLLLLIKINYYKLIGFVNKKILLIKSLERKLNYKKYLYKKLN